MAPSTTDPGNGNSQKPEKPAPGWRDRKFAAPIRYAEQSQPTPAVPPEPAAARFVADLIDRDRLIESPEPAAEHAESVPGRIAGDRVLHVPAGPPPTAVLVFHGMGQQVRFQTLSDLASGILDEAEQQGGTVDDVHICLAPKGDKPGQFLARAEITWKDKAGTQRQAHIYEAYWAPLTEGKVGYWDTIKFLIEGGLNGLSSIVRGRFKFPRWLFGDFQPMPITLTTPFALIGILLVLGLTVGLIAMALSAVAEIAHSIKGANPVAAAQAVVDTMYEQIASPWNWMMREFFHGAGVLVSPGGAIPRWQYALAIVAWLALIGAAYFVRNFIIEYVGSVAAYLSPYKDSKFEKLRGEIQKVGLDAARLIYYGGLDPVARYWVPDYRNIVIVGHSLGSVIAYDTLNAIFNIETTSNPPSATNAAVKRTKALITFGSPLDKSAFIFRDQFKRNSKNGMLREQAACAIQPLITNYSFRFDENSRPPGPMWINLWSPMDIISGSLGYYDALDVAATDPRHVANEIDWGAWIPLAAHIQYWNTRKFHRKVYDQLL
jgi:hypothetical protein